MAVQPALTLRLVSVLEQVPLESLVSMQAYQGGTVRPWSL